MSIFRNALTMSLFVLLAAIGCSRAETANISSDATAVPVVIATTTTTFLETTTSQATTTLPWQKRLVAVGDIACGPTSQAACNQDEVAELVFSLSPDAFLALGDIQYENGSYDSFIDVYDGLFGALKNITYPVPGNHEYYSGLSGYSQYFGDDYLYYSWDIGPWHIVGLDSENISTNQVDWLAQDLATTPSDCIIAYWHRPRWSSGVHGNYKPVDAFWKLLPEGSTVLSGHDHHFERFHPIDGITQFVIGTGGKSVRNVSTVQPQSATMYDDKFGVLVVDLGRDGYTWHFISTDYTILDTGSVVC